jgi:hypothetical protein
VGPRAGLDMSGKFRPTGTRFPDRPALSQSLYRLSYRARFPYIIMTKQKNVTAIYSFFGGIDVHFDVH